MYCSVCGGEIDDKLNFCNKCGTKLAKSVAEVGPKSISGLLVVSTTFIVIFGLGILVGLFAVLLGNGVPFDEAVKIGIFYLAALTFICFLVLRPLSKHASNRDDQPRKTSEMNTYKAPQLGKANPAALNEANIPVASVTEHTTRTLDKVLVERE